jgi:hypothetical protein
LDLPNIELQTVFPLLFVVMKRHYEIMRVMRTKIVNIRELSEGNDGIEYIVDAMDLRAHDLTGVSISSS